MVWFFNRRIKAKNKDYSTFKCQEKALILIKSNSKERETFLNEIVREKLTLASSLPIRCEIY